MFKFVNKTSKSLFVNSCRLNKGESSHWQKHVNQTYTCQSDVGTLIIFVGEHGIKTNFKDGKISATFDGKVVEIYEDV